jgi:hypothetical protein
MSSNLRKVRAGGRTPEGTAAVRLAAIGSDLTFALTGLPKNVRLSEGLDEAATRRKSDVPSHDVMRMVMSSILAT